MCGLAIPRLGKLAGTMSTSSLENGCVPRTECAAERQGGISGRRASWQAPWRHPGAKSRCGMTSWVVAEAFWKRQGYSTCPQTPTFLKAASEGEKDVSAARSSDEQISGFISVQDPTAIVKVEAGIGMVT